MIGSAWVSLMNTTDGDLRGCSACGVGSLDSSCMDGVGETGLGLGYGVFARRLASMYKCESIRSIVRIVLIFCQQQAFCQEI